MDNLRVVSVESKKQAVVAEIKTACENRVREELKHRKIRDE